MRETGFYWVKYIAHARNEVAYWNSRYWELTGNENRFSDDELEINEKQIKRDE